VQYIDFLAKLLDMAGTLLSILEKVLDVVYQEVEKKNLKDDK
jgi:hypothetical protein